MVAVDLYTDASIVKGRGAWACVVIRGDADPVEASGPLRGRFRSSAATEVAAIANGLHHARKAGLIEAGDEVAVWCDNIAACWYANGTARKLGSPSADPVMVDARRSIRDQAKRGRFTVTAAHVKGHQRRDSDDPRALFNIRCDHLCAAIRDGREAEPFEALIRKVEVARARKAKRLAREVEA